jgi:hypothetical protein
MKTHRACFAIALASALAACNATRAFPSCFIKAKLLEFRPVSPQAEPPPTLALDTGIWMSPLFRLLQAVGTSEVSVRPQPTTVAAQRGVGRHQTPPHSPLLR